MVQATPESLLPLVGEVSEEGRESFDPARRSPMVIRSCPIGNSSERWNLQVTQKNRRA